MFSIVKLRDALNVVLEQKASFVEATKEVLQQTFSFTGELEYPDNKCITFVTSLKVEKVTADITMYLSCHEILARFYKLKEVKISVPELSIEETVSARDLGLTKDLNIHSITHSKTSELHIKAKVIPY